ncbi:tetratricopeptide repeat protein [bacterium]|nr:tetratricopeptide repeat protein [bacterium]
MENENVYSILGLRKGAPDGEIKKAYVELIKKFDPEKHTDRFMVIQSAYERLRHPEKRAREDVLVFNYFRGRFLFTEDERTNDPDPKVNQELQALQTEHSQKEKDPEVEAAYIRVLMKRSFKKVGKRLWAEAMEDWQKILEINPTHQRAKSNVLYSYLTLGYSYAEHGLYEEAIELWEKAAQMNPDDADLIHNLAIGCGLAGKGEQSKRYWTETLRRWQARLEKDPDDTYTKGLIIEARRHLGGQQAIREEGKPAPSSVEEYREILKINPDDFEAQYKIASAVYEQQKWPEATDAWTQMVKKYPKNIEALNMLGWSLLNAGHIDRAFQMWNRALAMDPKNHSVREAVIKARMSVGRAFRNRGCSRNLWCSSRPCCATCPRAPKFSWRLARRTCSRETSAPPRRPIGRPSSWTRRIGKRNNGCRT